MDRIGALVILKLQGAPESEKRFSFEVATPESVYFMYASTEKEKDEWIGAIGRAIVKYSNVYTCDDDDY